MGKQQLILGDNLIELTKLGDNTIDAVVTDPPYGLKFMGKNWDYDVPSVGLWREVLRVLKPGGHLLSFGGTRTYHRMVCAIEDAGFEIRDQVQWIYGSGFPKSLDISKAIDKAAGAEREVVGKRKAHDIRSNAMHAQNGKGRIEIQYTAPATTEAKQWQGFGTALKPANEPIVLARKPLSEKTVAKNVLKWGTGGLNIDGCRVGDELIQGGRAGRKDVSSFNVSIGEKQPMHQGRFPANVMLDEQAAEMLDGQSGPCKTGGRNIKTDCGDAFFKVNVNTTLPEDTGIGASRFFYCAKASKRERNAGCKELLTWENVDQNLVDQMENLSLHLKGISEDTVRGLVDKEWNTILLGSNTTEQSRKAIKSTISITTKLITELKTLNYSQPSSTKGFIRDAIEAIEASGLSLAESAEAISQLKQNTTSEKMELALGAVLAVLKTLLKIKENAKQGNIHSTVKPIRLMQYLCRLITPPNGTILDPFMGSGSTGIAAINKGFGFVGIELNEEYFEIAQKRIKHAGEQTKGAGE